MKLRWTQRAAHAFATVLDYVEERNPAAATRMEALILKAAARIVDFPAACRHGRVSGTCEMVVPGTPYIIIYRVETQWVVILHLLHSKQQWPPQ
ncbi:MAG: type II toxin-antitoxin system RelE/ParE family toxin [Pseudomonadota bacterium]|nr:type II toxin-antitoxin system RelE/ParE family toxin [Pseudomonadota bacterium]